MGEINNQATPEMLEEVAAAQGLKEISFTAEGAKVTEVAPERFEKLVEVKAREMAGEIKLSRAQERLSARRKNASRAQIVEVNDGVDDWFVRSLSLPLLHELSLRTSRDELGALLLDDGEKYAQFLAAVLFVCLVTGKEDLSPYFERSDSGWSDALEQANDPEMTDSNSFLINAALILNPDILPEATSELERLMAEKAAQLEDDADPLAPAPESLKSSAGNLDPGSEATPFTSPPYISPTGFSSETEAHRLTSSGITP